MKYARVAEGTVLEVFVEPDGISIDACFTPQVAAMFEPCPDPTQQGWIKINGSFTPPPAEGE